MRGLIRVVSQVCGWPIPKPSPTMTKRKPVVPPSDLSRLRHPGSDFELLTEPAGNGEEQGVQSGRGQTRRSGDPNNRLEGHFAKSLRSTQRAMPTSAKGCGQHQVNFAAEFGMVVGAAGLHPSLVEHFQVHLLDSGSSPSRSTCFARCIAMRTFAIPAARSLDRVASALCMAFLPRVWTCSMRRPTANLYGTVQIC